MKPFTILALPRTGTKMLVSALSSHPDIPDVTHEFRGTEDEYWKHPYVLSNYIKDWMDDRIVKIHMYREDAIAGAKSMLLMPYQFPQRSFELPVSEVLEMAEYRRNLDETFAEVTELSVSYESLCGGKQIKQLPEWFTDDFCKRIGVKHIPLVTDTKKNIKLTPKNETGLQCLSV